MNKHLIGSVILVALLSACTSKPVKEPAKVEDKSVGVSQPAAGGSADTSGVSSDKVDGSSALDPRKDPNNILYQRSVYFDFDKDEVKAEYRPLVEAHAKYLLANPSASLVLQGNADERGSREYNLSLGQRRSVAVKKVMNLLGVQDKQIETVSYGEEKSQGCADEACHAKNRRVDVVYQGE